LASCFPELISHTWTLPLQLAVASSLPSRENATDSVMRPSPSSLATNWWVETSQIETPPVPCDEVASFLPSGENPTLTTHAGCSGKVAISWPLDTSQSLMRLSSPPVARSLPSGEKATELTPSPAWALMVAFSQPPSSTPRKQTVPS